MEENGLVENMSSLVCPHCGKTVDPFGSGKAEHAAAIGLKVLVKLPLDPEISRLGDLGEIEKYPVEFLKTIPGLLDDQMNNVQ